jgi:hypothetical protein
MRLLGRGTPARLFEYDARRRRLWIRGQRCQHGATGMLVALAGCVGLIASYAPAPRQDADARPLVVLALAGGALMAHDWNDRSVWFQRGRGPRR